MERGWIIALVLIGGVACEEQQTLAEMPVYEGPVAEATAVEMLYSDSAQVRIRLTAPLQREFANGNRTFPEGIYLEFFEVDGQQRTTIRADSGFYDHETNLYTGVGDVVVEDMLAEKQLNTEKLHWNQAEQNVFTDVFVRIRTPKEVLMGEGLTAAQDFSSYRILKPTGVFAVDEL